MKVAVGAVVEPVAAAAAESATVVAVAVVAAIAAVVVAVGAVVAVVAAIPNWVDFVAAETPSCYSGVIAVVVDPTVVAVVPVEGPPTAAVGYLLEAVPRPAGWVGTDDRTLAGLVDLAAEGTQTGATDSGAVAPAGEQGQVNTAGTVHCRTCA